MKNVMTRAWEIAREGVKKFGGKVKEYFAQALVMAWAEIKKGVEKVELELSGDTRRWKTWVAAIVGKHPIYKLDRKFINPYEVDQYGDKIFRLENGFYELQNHKQRMFIEVTNGSYEIVEKSYVMEQFA